MIFGVKKFHPYILEVKKMWTFKEPQNELMTEMRLEIRNLRTLVCSFSIFCLFLTFFFSLFIFLSFVPMSFDSMFLCCLTDPINSSLRFCGLHESLLRNMYVFKRKVQRNIKWKIMNDPRGDFFLQKGYFLYQESIFLHASTPLLSLLQKACFGIKIQWWIQFT